MLKKEREGNECLLMLNRRKSPRRKMVLPVKVSIDKVTHLAHTLDISPTGARLGALRTQLQPGMIISLQRGLTKAEFRVQWIRQLGPDQQQAGVESLEPQNNFWGVDLSDEFEAKKNVQTLLTVLSHRSKSAM
jgi:PilZ domain